MRNYSYEKEKRIHSSYRRVNKQKTRIIAAYCKSIVCTNEAYVNFHL